MANGKLNKELRSWRKELRITQPEAAAMFGVPANTYRNWEYGVVGELPGPAKKLWSLLRKSLES
jgi:DNA-binding transcriptional regulator YiaG